MEFHNFGFLPDWVLFEFAHEDFVLLAVLSKALLCFLGTLDSVSDDNTGNATLNAVLLALWRVLVSANLIVFVGHEFSGHLKGSSVLVEGSL